MTGQGTGTGPAPEMDTTGLAKESTLEEISGKLNGTAAGTGIVTGDAGTWYMSEGKTYQGVMTNGLSQIQAAPIMSFGRDIFAVSVPSGSCPTWTIPGVMGMSAVDVSVLCGDIADGAWSVVAGVLKFLSVMIAFRIAVSAV